MTNQLTTIAALPNSGGIGASVKVEVANPDAQKEAEILAYYEKHVAEQRKIHPEWAIQWAEFASSHPFEPFEYTERS